MNAQSIVMLHSTAGNKSVTRTGYDGAKSPQLPAYPKTFVMLVIAIRVMAQKVGEIFCRWRSRRKFAAEARPHSATSAAPRDFDIKERRGFLNDDDDDEGAAGSEDERPEFSAPGMCALEGNESTGGTRPRRQQIGRNIATPPGANSSGSGAGDELDKSREADGRRVSGIEIAHQVLTKSATEMAQMIRLRQITCRNLVDMHIARVKDVDRQLNCVAHDNFREAVEAADAVDASIAELYVGGCRHGLVDNDEPHELRVSLEKLEQDQPFLGVPFTCKESYSVAGIPHVVGLGWRTEVIGESDSVSVAAMKAAGAILLATTTVPEMCFWWETFSTLRGTTRNPHDVTRSSGGSSGGEAALIASCGSPLGVGSDFYGSIRYPAAFTGIYGHKPTRGLCDMTGHFPYTDTGAGTAGPMARHLEDLAPAVEVMSGGKFRYRQPSLAPPTLAAGPNNNRCDSSSDADARSLSVAKDQVEAGSSPKHVKENVGSSTGKQSIRFLVLDKFAPLWYHGYTSRIEDMLDSTIDALKRLGYDVVKVEVPALNFGAEIFVAEEVERTDLSYDPKQYLIKTPSGRKLDESPVRVNVFAELARKLMGMKSQFCFSTLYSCAVVAITQKNFVRTSNSFVKFRELRKSLESQLQELLGEDGVLLMPTVPHPAPYHGQSYFMPYLICYTGVFNILGMPVTQIPMPRLLASKINEKKGNGDGCDVGTNSSPAAADGEDLPIGLQIIGCQNQDRLTLRAAEIVDSIPGAGWIPPWGRPGLGSSGPRSSETTVAHSTQS